VSKREPRKHRISRRIGENLWGGKSPVTTRNFPPGQHGTLGYKKLTDYGAQLKEKQKLKGYYGDITETQFRKIYDEATRRKGDTGENMIGLLESRLATIIYRANFAPTIFSARQLINHGHVMVNGRRVNIASAMIRPGDVIELKASSKQLLIVTETVQRKERSIPEYLDVDLNNLVVKYVRTPSLSDVPFPVVMHPQVVVEYYSR